MKGCEAWILFKTFHKFVALQNNCQFAQKNTMYKFHFLELS
jgi:hypothetical protein